MESRLKKKRWQFWFNRIVKRRIPAVKSKIWERGAVTVLLVTACLTIFLAYKNEERYEDFVNKIVSENNITYDTAQSMTTNDYDIHVRGNDNGDKTVKVINRHNGHEYGFRLHKDGTFSVGIWE